MSIIIFLILAGLPLAEIAIFIQAGGAIGAWPVVGLVALSAFAGIWLMRLQGPATLRRAQASMQRGEPPVAEMLEGTMLFIAAVLMVTPGFLTSTLGLAMLVAPLRRLAARLAAQRLAMRAEIHVHDVRMRRGPGGPIIEAEAEEPDVDGEGNDQAGRGSGRRQLPPKADND